MLLATRNLLTQILSCVSYSVSSVFMVVAQKYILARGITVEDLFLFQTICSFALSIVVKALSHRKRRSSWVQYHVIRKTVPLTILFSGMLLTSSLSLQYLRFATYAVMKNLAPIFVFLVEWRQSPKREKFQFPLFASTILLFLGNFFVAREDFDTSFQGYFWMFMNMAFTVGYVLYLRHCSVQWKIDDRDTVFNMNMQSLMWCIPKYLITDHSASISDQASTLMTTTAVKWLVFLTGMNGMILSLTTMWCLRMTSGATYSMIGALNKIPISIIGAFLEPAMSKTGQGGLVVALVSGVLYSAAKAQKQESKFIEVTIGNEGDKSSDDNKV